MRFPIATYTELQKEYLDAQTALLTAQTNALEARQKVELLIGPNENRRRPQGKRDANVEVTT